MPAENIDLLRCDTPLANVPNVCKTLVVVSCCLPPADTCLAPSLDAPLRASCPMGCRPRPVPCPPQKPPELTHPARPEVCTLSATALISRPFRAMPCLREMMYRAITNALPHHLSWGSHAQATQCTSSLVVCPRHSPILLNLPLCGPSMPVRWTFNFHAHCSNGFATCKTGEIIDAQACLAKPPRWKARERKTCQQTSLVPGSLGRGHSITVAQNKAARPKSRAITNIQQLARMPPRLPIHTCHAANINIDPHQL
jgi:hypothetical protein